MHFRSRLRSERGMNSIVPRSGQAEDAQACALSFQTFGTHMARVCRRFVDGNTPDLHVRGCRNTFRRNAMIKNCVVAWDDPGKSNALIEDSRAPLALERVTPWIVVT